MAERLFGKGVGIDTPAPVALRPAPLTGDIYSRQPVANGASQLADALGTIAPALLAYGTMAAKLKNDPNSRENKDFENPLYTKSIDELHAMAAAGDLPNVQADALSAILGAKAATDFQTSTTTWATNADGNGFDASAGDMSAELDARRRKYAAGLPNDAARASFWKGSEGYSQRLVGSDTDRRIVEASTARDDGVFSQYQIIVDEGLHAGKSPEDIATSIMAASTANRTFAKLDGPAQNATLYRLAEKLAAEGRPELVKALAGASRKGVPSLGETGDYSTKLIKLVESATNIKEQEAAKLTLPVRLSVDKEVAAGTFTEAKAKALATANPVGFTPEYWAANVNQSNAVKERLRIDHAKFEAEAVFRQTNLASRNSVLAGATKKFGTVLGVGQIADIDIPNATGTGTEKVTAKEQIAFVVAGIEADIKAQADKAQSMGMSKPDIDQQSFNSRIQRYAGAGYINPAWDATLNGAPIAATKALIESGKPIPPELTDAASLYTKLYAADPVYAARLVSKDSETFYEEYRWAVEDGKVPEQAMKMAADAAALPASARQDPTPTQIEELLAATDVTEPNASDHARANDVLSHYLLRMSPEKAIERATERLKATTTTVHGVMVSSNDRNFPKDFKEVTEGILAEYVKTHPDDSMVDDAEDLSVRRIGPLLWTIIHKADGSPVLTDSRLGPENLQEYRDREQGAAAKRAAAAVKVKEKGGIPAIVLNWFKGSPRATEDSMSPAEANKFLSDKTRAQKIETYVAGEAERKGFQHLQGNGYAYKQWVDTKGNFVEPVVIWTDERQSIAWKTTGQKFVEQPFTQRHFNAPAPKDPNRPF